MNGGNASENETADSTIEIDYERDFDDDVDERRRGRPGVGLTAFALAKDAFSVSALGLPRCFALISKNYHWCTLMLFYPSNTVLLEQQALWPRCR